MTHGFTGRLRAMALAGPLAALVPAGPALADPAPPFAQLLRQAAASPRIAAMAADVERAEGAAEQVRARPNPSLSLYTENVAGSSPYAGFGRAETTLQYNHPFEIGGKRSARIAAGAAGVVAARARGVEGRLSYAHELARAYVAVEVAERRIGLSEDEVEEATADLTVARAMVAAGREARLRAVQAQTALDANAADLAMARANHAAALAQLSALAGVATPFTGLGESLLDRMAARTATGPVDPMQGAAYRAAAAERDAAGLRVIAERKRALPDVSAQLGVRRLEADRATALVAGVSLPLALFDRNRGNIAAAQAELRGADARAAAARLEAEAGARSAGLLATAADARAEAAARTMATAEEAYRLSRIAYEAGKSPLSELLVARHGLGVARGVVLDAAAARFEARAMLARLQGLTITGEPVQ